MREKEGRQPLHAPAALSAFHLTKKETGEGMSRSEPRKPKKKTKSVCFLTPLQELGDVLLPPERGVVALIVETHQDVQQGLHAQALAVGASRPVLDQLLQLFQTHFPRHVVLVFLLGNSRCNDDGGGKPKGGGRRRGKSK